MKTSGYLLTAITLLFAFPFSGCKKGEGDPFISFKSRKARVVGEWNIIKYDEMTSTSDYSGNITTTISFDGSAWTNTYTGSGTTSTQLSTGSYTFSFTRDGQYTMKKTITPVSAGTSTTTTWEETGIWDFLTGVGEKKNKEYIGLTITKQMYSSNGSSSISTSGGQAYSVWQITTLKNKEMVLHLEEEDTNSSTGSTTTNVNTTIDITLTQ